MASLLAAVVVGCGPANDNAIGCSDLAVPSTLPGERAAKIVDGAARWNTFVGREVVRIVVADRDVCTFREGPVPPGAAGAFRREDETLTLDLSQMLPSEYEQVAMHEIGHYLTMEHVGEGIMAPVPGPDFTDEDRAECIRVSVCR